jgi:steroid delta-isomerase-like uncharacterized protein
MNRRHFLTATTAIAATAWIAAPAFAQNSAKAIVEAYVAAWNAHDAAKAASYFADNVSYYDASVGKPAQGMADAKAVIDGFLAAAPDAAWTIKGAPVAEGDRVSFEWEFAGTNTGDWHDGTKATGKKFAFTGASMFTVKDGKIVAQSDYYDALGFYKQLGLM